MYVPKHFEQADLHALRWLVRTHPLGALVTLTHDGLEANHIPFLWHADPAPYGILQGHIARANPLWRNFLPEIQALVIFRGPALYISPAWYPSKTESAQVVPTWNYVVVHAHGPLRVMDDPDWMRAHLEEHTSRHESRRPDPWKVNDAPAAFIEKMMKAIVGLEIPIARLVGKWKLSQNRSVRDREGVVDGLTREGTEPARAMASMVRQVHGVDPGKAGAADS